MPKDKSYHEAAVFYNETLAEFAEKTAASIEHPEIRRWCESVAKQHRFHEGRHRDSLEKLNNPSAKKKKPNKNRRYKKRRSVETPKLEDGVIADSKTFSDGSVFTTLTTESSENASDLTLDTAKLNAQIEALHGPGAVDALEKAFDDGSIFSDAAEGVSAPQPESVDDTFSVT